MIVVHTLGTAHIDAGQTLFPPASRKFALLLYLSVERGRRLPRPLLQELLFPDQTEENARHSLRQIVYQLRRAGVEIASDKGGLELGGDVRSDYVDFIAQERPTIEQLAAAEGGFLPGLEPDHLEAFTEWLATFRARITLELSKQIIKELTRAKRIGDWLTVERAARACLALNPMNEQATFALAEMLAIGGAKSQAARLLDQYSAEVGPGSELRLPALMIKRRIDERIADTYRRSLTLPFLGRDEEMRALSDRFERARTGLSQCVVLVGEAGIGKTRLAEEFCTYASLKGACVERVLTQPHDTHRPMGVFADLVPRLLQLPGALGCSTTSMTALRRLTTHESGEAPVAPPEVNSEVISAAITRAIADLIDAITAEAPLVLRIDDAQWADELSLRTLGALTSAKHDRQLLIVLTSRDRSVVQFFSQRSEHALAISVVPLTQQSVATLLGRVFDDEETSPVDVELRAWMGDTSAGNPFFLRCLIGHFQSTAERFSVPSSVSSLLDQQVAALGAEATAVLGMCVALGRYAEVDRVIRAAELPHLQLQIALRELELSHLVVQRDQRIEPAHWLISEAVDRATLPIASKLLHRRVATLLELEARTSRSAPQFWDCAEHWVLAGDYDRAAGVMRECANHSIEIGRPREAAQVLLRAARSVEGDSRLALTTLAVQVADAAGEYDIVLQGADFARQSGAPIDYDGVELAEMTARISESDHPDNTIDRLRYWLSADRPLRHRVKAGTIMLLIADHQSDASLADEAFGALSQAFSSIDDCDDLSCLRFLLIYHSVFGSICDSCRVAHRLLLLADATTPAEAADLQRKSAVALWRGGEVAAALSALQNSNKNARDSGLRRLECASASMLAGFLADIGDDDASAEWLTRVHELVHELLEHGTSLNHAIMLAEVACARGDANEIRRWRASAYQHSPKDPTLRTKRWLALFDARIHQIEKRVPDLECAVAALVGHHIQHRETGNESDGEIAVALHLLYDHGQLDRARRLLARYITHFRRSRNPWMMSLTKAAARVAGHLDTSLA